MWKFAFIGLLACLSTINAQEVVTLTCEFRRTLFGEYACFLEGIEVLDPSATIEITGEHLEGYQNEDVDVAAIVSSNTPFMIQEIFTTFPNIYELEYTNSNLQSISIPETANLIYLILDTNNISRIEAGAFSSQPMLFYVELFRCNVQEVDENAFEGLTELAGLVLWENNISELPPRVFHSLINVLLIDLEANALTSISEELFANSSRLEILYLDGNEIREVHPSFAASLRNRLSNLYMRGNNCVDRLFTIRDEIGWMDVNNALQTCFNNFDGTEPEVREIIVEFTGNLRVFDRFRNIIASI